MAASFVLYAKASDLTLEVACQHRPHAHEQLKPISWLQAPGSFLIDVFALAWLSCARAMRLWKLLQKLCSSICEAGS